MDHYDMADTVWPWSFFYVKNVKFWLKIFPKLFIYIYVLFLFRQIGMIGFKTVGQRNKVAEKQSLFDHIAADWRLQHVRDYTLVDCTLVDYQNFVDQIAQDQRVLLQALL